MSQEIRPLDLTFSETMSLFGRLANEWVQDRIPTEKKLGMVISRAHKQREAAWKQWQEAKQACNILWNRDKDTGKIPVITERVKKYGAQMISWKQEMDVLAETLEQPEKSSKWQRLQLLREQAAETIKGLRTEEKALLAALELEEDTLKNAEEAYQKAKTNHEALKNHGPAMIRAIKIHEAAVQRAEDSRKEDSVLVDSGAILGALEEKMGSAVAAHDAVDYLEEQDQDFDLDAVIAEEEGDSAVNDILAEFS